MTHPSGNLFVIAAPSGAGKTSLVKALSESLTQFQISVSHTTRAMRPGEVDGQNYFFVDHETFDAMASKQAFLEHATVFGNHYGTSRSWVHDHLREGTDVVLEIDWQGARQIKTLFPKAVLIFILPPSMEALKLRLQTRKQDDSYTIERRMDAAQAEMSHYREFDYLVINDQFDVALRDLQHIVQAMRLKMDVQIQKQPTLLDNLLKKK
ncbi:MAG: guanylate kinase [Gammaproteobacteria bacterium RIFCSPHIGHO2_12_FULL_38_11]|nr:MAG: guanylate kinase [Gammaproteobacteria bacterium RIFCSPHIGHO2_12_FULL_38_11]